MAIGNRRPIASSLKTFNIQMMTIAEFAQNAEDSAEGRELPKTFELILIDPQCPDF